MSDIYTIKKGTLNFPNLYHLPVINGQKSEKFSTKVLLDPVQHAAIVQRLQLAIAELVKVDLKGAKVGSNMLCLRKGDDTGREENAGKWVLSAANKRPPVVVNRDGSPLLEDEGKIYSGCVCNVNVTLWAQNNAYGKRINCNLEAVQFVADGEPLAGGGVSRDAAVAGFDVEDGADPFGDL